MTLNVAIQMDPIERIDIGGDSTFALALEAQSRGHRLLYYGPRELSFSDGEVIAAMNLSAPAANETPDATLERLLTPLNTAAVAVERELRGDLFG